MRIFDDTEITSGGAYPHNKKWMDKKYVKARVTAWVMRSLETGKEQPNYDTKNQWIPRQCSWCKWFGALEDSDYGFCFNIKSPNEGYVTFEHGGCKFHSSYFEDGGVMI